jgi:heat-inducible transcriptional repressor
MIQELNERSRQIFRHIVESYLETGEPVGSRTLSQRLRGGLSPASIRNVMADLEDAGLLFAPHASAGRLPTEIGLRIFVDGLLEIGNLADDERKAIENRVAAEGRGLEEVLTEATRMLSGLSQCAGLVVAPKLDKPLRHIEFVGLGPTKALVVIVTDDGMVENRVVEVPAGMTPSMLTQASNYLNARLVGRSIAGAAREILVELEQNRAELDQLTARVVEAGLAKWAGGSEAPTLIVSGQSHLLDDLSAAADLERIRRLFDDLENKRDLLQLLERANEAEGVRIFIGSENKLFSLSGSSLIVAPYANSRDQIVGMIGVIGPTRVNYGRVIPMVDYTAKVIGRLMG